MLALMLLDDEIDRKSNSALKSDAFAQRAKAFLTRRFNDACCNRWDCGLRPARRQIVDIVAVPRYEYAVVGQQLIPSFILCDWLQRALIINMPHPRRPMEFNAMNGLPKINMNANHECKSMQWTTKMYSDADFTSAPARRQKHHRRSNSNHHHNPCRGFLIQLPYEPLPSFCVCVRVFGNFAELSRPIHFTNLPFL